MARVAFDVEGAQQLQTALRQLPADLSDMRGPGTRAGRLVGETAAQRAPRRSGALAASMRSEASKSEAVIRFGGGAVPYAAAVHWGVGPRAGMRGPHNIRRNPFAWNAAQDTERTWLEFYIDEMQTAADKAMERVP